MQLTNLDRYLGLTVGTINIDDSMDKCIIYFDDGNQLTITSRYGEPLHYYGYES